MIFCLPFIVGFLVFLIVPMGISLYYSFCDYDILSPPEFVGLKNYIEMFTQDEVFWHSVKATFYFALVSVPLRLIFALLVAMILIIAILLLLDIDYDTFCAGSSFISFLLGPSVVALGYALYEQIEQIRGKEIPVLTAVIAGGIVGIVSVIAICQIMGVDEAITSSLQPKSVTIPIAISLSEHSHGIPSLTAVIVFGCGLLGGIVGPAVLNRCHVHSSVARGLALGSAAHGLGTARAIELGAVEGAISGLAIGLMGVVTSLLIPFFESIMR